MKKATIFIMAAILCLCAASVSAQKVSSDSDATLSYVSRDYREVYVPFKKSPPSFYYVPDHIILKLKSEISTTEESKLSTAALTGFESIDELNKKFKVEKFVREFPDIRAESNIHAEPNLRKYYIIKYSNEFEMKEVLEAYANDINVEGAQPIGVHPIYERIPNDSYFLSDQWNFYDVDDNDVDATDAWDYETGDETVILGLLDTGLQYNSGDLGGSSPYTQGNVWINWSEYEGTTGIDDDGNGYIDDWVGWDFVDNVYPLWPGEDGDTPDNEPTDFNGHGTHVGGIMGAITNNSYMVAGLAGGWNENASDPANGVKIMGLRIGWSAPYQGYEVGYVRMDFAAQAIYYAVNKGVTAINCSWGSSNTGGLAAAVDYATANGVLVVAAAGNDGDSYPDYLGNRADVINVAATDDDDVKASFSNYGTWVDVAAPGVDILSTFSYHYNPAYIAWISGTSQAAPHVTGEAGFLKSYADTLTRDQIENLIRTYVDDIDKLNPGYGGLLGSGRINVFKAIDGVEAPQVTVIQPNGGEVLYIGQIYTIIWEASDNVGIASTIIEYSVDSGENWMFIAELEGNPGSYDWTVTGPPSDQCRMKVTCYDAVGLAGSDMSDEDFCPPYKRSPWSFAIKATGDLPAEFALHQNHPNPFNPSTEIIFALPQACDVTLSVYNILGRKVATLADGQFEAGTHNVIWNGRNETGGEISSGLYFYRIKAGENTAVRKMLLLK